MNPEQLAKHPLAVELAACGNLFHRWQWSLASSSNYSALLDEKTIIISRSGVDKERMSSADFLLVDMQGNPLPAYSTLKPSAETELHCHAYRTAQGRGVPVGCVLHTHSKYAVFYSRKLLQAGAIAFSDFEMQKIFEKITTHESTVTLPIFPNSQEMPDIIKNFDLWLAGNAWPPGYLIAGHGIYAWGKTVLHAKQKLEALEYLMELKFMEEVCKAD